MAIGLVLALIGGIVVFSPVSVQQLAEAAGPALAPWLAFTVAALLVVYGFWQGLRAVRVRGADRGTRLAHVLAAVASVTAGAVAFAWPVLTLSAFRLWVGAWLVFVGLQLVFQALARKRSGSFETRGWLRAIGAGISLVVAAFLALTSGWLLDGAALPQPSSFYTPPASVPAEPGKLIRFEPLLTGTPVGAEGWRILYTTTNPDGSAAVSSGTVVAPRQRSDRVTPVLSVSHGTTGVADKCAPSLSETPLADGAAAALETLVTEHGWAAVTSDYVGLGTAGTHPYLVGEAEARNVLDATRAARQIEKLTLAPSTVVWGHSQGGQGALWTGQIAEDYAPDVTVTGIAALAPASDLFGLAEANKNDAVGKTVSAYIAATWSELYPELELKAHLTPGSARGIEKIQGLCFNGQDALGAILQGTQVPNQIFPDELLAGPFGDKLRAQTPTGPFPAPVLVAQGLADPLVRPAEQRAWVEARCAAGAEIDYREFDGLDHLSLVAPESPLTPQLVEWTLDRAAGEPATPTCGA